MRTLTSLVVALGLLFTALPAGAGPGAATAQAPGELPLRVQVVVSRYQGEKRISSIPYSLAVVAIAPTRGVSAETTRLRMGVDVPVPTTVVSEGVPRPSYNYRSVGTNIDCSALIRADGGFKLDLTVSDTAVFVPEKESASTAQSRVNGVPAFRTFTSNFNLLLKDGQSAQHTSATDPVSGEVLRVDVTLTVLK